jgi:hypothetical protein
MFPILYAMAVQAAGGASRGKLQRSRDDVANLAAVRQPVFTFAGSVAHRQLSLNRGQTCPINGVPFSDPRLLKSFAESRAVSSYFSLLGRSRKEHPISGGGSPNLQGGEMRRSSDVGRSEPGWFV